MGDLPPFPMLALAYRHNSKTSDNKTKHLNHYSTTACILNTDQKNIPIDLHDQYAAETLLHTARENVTFL
jgi:hypothetical protein